MKANVLKKLTNWQKLSLLMFVVAGMIAILKLLTPTTTPQDNPQITEVGGAITQVPKLEYLGEELIVPEKLPLAAAELMDTSQMQSGLVSRFAQTASPNSTNLWTGEDFSLYFDSVASSFNLSPNQPQPISTTLDETQVTNQARDLVAELLPNANLEIDSARTKFFAGQYEQKQVSNNLAEYIELSFVPKYQGYSVFHKDALLTPVLMLYDANGLITKLELSTLIYELTPSEEQATVSLDQAIGQIKQGVASVIDLETNSTLPINKSGFASGRLNTVELEYRVDNNRVAKPYYKFSGNVVTTAGQTVKAVIITPATQ
jgi:hypothetical protein